ncbi:MAG: tRNA 2-thiouridine(34) synthase MnmA [Lachnospiraceae bacterium]|nr:tRNA 2-thiouridine(34) synthase MnmA [Lachnospiraceae bacterium]
MSKKVMVGMSGGVDSSVAAYLLKEQGYDVIGCTLHLFDADSSCCGIEGAYDAKVVCRKLGIDHKIIHFNELFSEKVINYFVDEYRRGFTPNPCIACNYYIKWQAMLDEARKEGCDYIATGHYAYIKHLPNGRYAFSKAKSQAKDQSYVLYNLSQEMLKSTLMPLGDYEKDDVRRIAEDIGLMIADKPDSQDICFVENGDYYGFMVNHCGYSEKPGHFVDKEGNILGDHQGISHFTIGQRKGLGIAFGEPRYVLGINPLTREVVLGSNEDLMTTKLKCNMVNAMAVESFAIGQRLSAKIRYSHKGENATVSSVSETGLELSFDAPVRAVTPGQAVVFYDGDIVLGGGHITQ